MHGSFCVGVWRQTDGQMDSITAQAPDSGSNLFLVYVSVTFSFCFIFLGCVFLNLVFDLFCYKWQCYFNLHVPLCMCLYVCACMSWVCSTVYFVSLALKHFNMFHNPCLLLTSVCFCLKMETEIRLNISVRKNKVVSWCSNCFGFEGGDFMLYICAVAELFVCIPARASCGRNGVQVWVCAWKKGYD